MSHTRMSDMSGTGIALIIGQIAVLVTALASAWVSVRNSRKLDRVETRVETVHDLAKKVQEETNGMKTELVNEVRAASFAKGVKSETDKAIPS